MIGLQVIAAWFLADLLSGVVHYVMDLHTGPRFRPDVAKDNELHHFVPASIGGFTYRQNLQNSVPSLLFALALWLERAPPALWLAFVFLFFANVVHRWAHAPRSEVPRFAQALQRVGVFQSPAHHAGHHYERVGMGVRRLLNREEARVRFCVMTDYVNPAVDFLRRAR